MSKLSQLRARPELNILGYANRIEDNSQQYGSFLLIKVSCHSVHNLYLKNKI